MGTGLTRSKEKQSCLLRGQAAVSASSLPPLWGRGTREQDDLCSGRQFSGINTLTVGHLWFLDTNAVPFQFPSLRPVPQPPHSAPPDTPLQLPPIPPHGRLSLPTTSTSTTSTCMSDVKLPEGMHVLQK